MEKMENFMLLPEVRKTMLEMKYKTRNIKKVATTAKLCTKHNETLLTMNKIIKLCDVILSSIDNIITAESGLKLLMR